MKKQITIVMGLLAWLMTANIAETLLMQAGIPEWMAIISSIAVILVFPLVMKAPRVDNIVRNDLTVDVTIWAREIAKRFFKDNSFLKYSKNESQYVMGGSVVVIPQPGARPVVVKNRSVYPATAVRRSDSVISYVLDEYSTNPTHIALNDLATISYDKIQSIITDHFGYLMQDAADDMLIKWAENVPEAFVVNTSGADTAALESGQTGLRKAMVWQDLREASRLMNKANLPKDNRFAVLEENLFQQLFDSLANTQYKDFARDQDAKEGTIGRLFGFNIITRSSAIVAQRDFDGDGILQVNALGEEIAETDDVGCLCYHQDAVANAMGTINLFNRANDPLYYGDVNSVSMRQGGRVRREDGVGLVVIKQGAAAGN